MYLTDPFLQIQLQGKEDDPSLIFLPIQFPRRIVPRTLQPGVLEMEELGLISAENLHNWALFLIATFLFSFFSAAASFSSSFGSFLLSHYLALLCTEAHLLSFRPGF